MKKHIKLKRWFVYALCCQFILGMIPFSQFPQTINAQGWVLDKDYLIDAEKENLSILEWDTNSNKTGCYSGGFHYMNHYGINYYTYEQGQYLYFLNTPSLVEDDPYDDKGHSIRMGVSADDTCKQQRTEFD